MTRRAFHLALALLLAAAVPALAQIPPAKGAGKPSFRELDANRDGAVSLEEVLAWATKKGVRAGDVEVSKLDANGDGILSAEELRAAGLGALAPYGGISVRELDVDGDGVVTRREVEDFLRRRVEEDFRKADADHDGSLRPREFALFRFSIPGR